MAILLEEQWELDGYVFGGNADHRKPVYVLHSGLDYGAASLRVDDKPSEGADGLVLGRDFVDGPEMQLTLGVEHSSDVWPVLAQLAAVWRPDSRKTPGATSVLRYCRNGKVLRFIGRPRRFGVKPGANKNDRFQAVEVTFQLAEATQYLEDSDNVAVLRLLALNEKGGLTFPVTFPVVWNSGVRQERVNGVVVDSAAPVPFTCTIKGPVSGSMSGIRIAGNGWAIQTSASCAWDQTITIDTRLQTITRNGAHIPGTLTRESSLRARLMPGLQTLSFSGVDPTNTATATFQWHSAIPL